MVTLFGSSVTSSPMLVLGSALGLNSVCGPALASRNPGAGKPAIPMFCPSLVGADCCALSTAASLLGGVPGESLIGRVLSMPAGACAVPPPVLVLGSLAGSVGLPLV